MAALAVGSLRHAALREPRRGRAARARPASGSARAPTSPCSASSPSPPDDPRPRGRLRPISRPRSPRRPVEAARPPARASEAPQAVRARHAAALLRAPASTVHDATADGAVEPWLAACDVVTTCFSHCSMDYAFLGAWSREPLGVGALPAHHARRSRRFMRGLRRHGPARRRRSRASAGSPSGPRTWTALLAARSRPTERAALPRGEPPAPAGGARRPDRRRGAGGGRGRAAAARSRAVTAPARARV